MNQQQIPIDLLHPFFRYGSVAEREVAAAVLEAARNAQGVIVSTWMG